MNKSKPDIKLITEAQRGALSSPLRLEIIGLYARADLLSIADMAESMGVRAGSLYHHVSILEDAGVLRRAGTRRKGKRDEALFELLEDVMGLGIEPGDEEAKEHARRTVASAFRMAERDFGEALAGEEVVAEGPGRNILATRIHTRVSPRTLASINKHLDAIFDMATRDASKSTKSARDDDQYISLTLALLPLRGRGKR